MSYMQFVGYKWRLILRSTASEIQASKYECQTVTKVSKGIHAILFALFYTEHWHV